MVGMFKKKQQDKELLDGKIFSGELSEIGVKSQEDRITCGNSLIALENSKKKEN